MDYELIWWCIVGAICFVFFVCCIFCDKSSDTVSKDTLDRLNGKRSRDNWIDLRQL